MRRCDTFVVRCWSSGRTPRGERSVIDVEHVQSGDRTRVKSLSEASDWIDTTCRSSISAEAPPAEQDEA